MRNHHIHRLVVPALLALTAAACGDTGSTPMAAAAIGCSAITADNIDDCVRMNEIQTIGTHNSYHKAPEPAMMAWLGDRARNIDYTHRPLTEQLGMLGIRQIELDVFADPEGGRYATPAALRLVEGLDPVSADLAAPGFKIIHGQDVDYRTTCATLVACLTEIRDWSLEHPTHVPILVLIEAKDAPRNDPDDVDYVQPLPIGAIAFRALDAEIRSVFAPDQLITPADVRGARGTLNEAILTDGWPRLGEARGHVIFALDNTDAHRDAYIDGASSLDDRVLFVSAPAGDPMSAFLKLNEALGEDEAAIREHVAAGYLVRTRADIPTREARSGDTSRRDAAFRTGAQYVSTDYPEVSPFGSGYIARLPGAEALAARCNPVNAPTGCRDEWLEPQ